MTVKAVKAACVKVALPEAFSLPRKFGVWMSLHFADAICELADRHEVFFRRAQNLINAIKEAAGL